jgi:transposase
MLDNAKYHKSHLVLKKYTEHKIPIFFLGPYHFKLAAIENVFSMMKNRNLNEFCTYGTSKYITSSLILTDIEPKPNS